MAEINKSLVGMTGIWISGDLGPWTIYTNKNRKKVFYPRSPPTKPPTRAQFFQRERWKLAARDWQARPKEEKEKWERVTKKLTLPLTGYNLFTWAELHINPAKYLETVFHQAHELPVPTYQHR